MKHSSSSEGFLINFECQANYVLNVPWPRNHIEKSEIGITCHYSLPAEMQAFLPKAKAKKQNTSLYGAHF
jgi:hypothetical protein